MAFKVEFEMENGCCSVWSVVSAHKTNCPAKRHEIGTKGSASRSQKRGRLDDLCCNSAHSWVDVQREDKAVDLFAKCHLNRLLGGGLVSMENGMVWE